MAEISITTTINYIIDWLQLRLKERTSWDGLTIIVISILALIASPLIKYAAWVGLGYGAWTLWRKDKPL
ncbi:MAG: hypothetical protein HOP02_16385 [Methylococcaceae bacterium]|nr:hypothetical protein [Methylococcaceae bacterium]